MLEAPKCPRRILGTIPVGLLTQTDAAPRQRRGEEKEGTLRSRFGVLICGKTMNKYDTYVSHMTYDSYRDEGKTISDRSNDTNRR